MTQGLRVPAFHPPGLPTCAGPVHGLESVRKFEFSSSIPEPKPILTSFAYRHPWSVMRK